MENMGIMNVNEKFWQDRNVLVTGATGFLGAWLTGALSRKGANVTALVRDRVSRSRLETEDLVNHIDVVSGDIEDFFLLQRVLNEYEIQTVFHLAAQTIVGIANRNPLSTFETNIKGTWNLLEAARGVSTIEQIVVASSDKAYGDQETLPYEETFPLQGAHPYDVSKSCADLISFTYFKSYALPVCITRCGNFYGGGDLNFNRIVPGTIRSALRDKNPIIRSDGSFIRDYIYIENAVEAYIMLAEKMSEDKGLHGEAFNMSCENQMTALELVEKILSVMGRDDLKPEILGEASNEINHQYLSAKKAREILGWKPAFSVDEGLKLTIEWYKDFFKDNKC